MTAFFEALQFPFMYRALIVGVLVSLCAALLGVVLVLKHYSLIGHGLGEVGFAALALAVALDLPPMTVAIPLVVIASFLIMYLSQRADDAFIDADTVDHAVAEKQTDLALRPVRRADTARNHSFVSFKKRLHSGNVFVQI